MSGHSKWANIKHKKAASDKKKGRIFSRLAKEIMLAVRNGGTDANANTRLRTALTAARTSNMPKDNVERAIKKGSGEMEGVNFEEITYEGYGAGGVAILVECMTDNRNRTAGEIRMLFDRGGGALAGSGAVSWQFKRKAHVVVTGENADENKLMDIVLDAGADDIQVDGDIAEIWGAPDALEGITKALENAKIPFSEAGVVQRPDNVVAVKDVHVAQQVMRLVEKLEDHDDIQSVHSNLEVAEEIAGELEKLMG
ncbi:MAG: transcriptional regulator [Lentisphaerae bacterium GWF2_52_8]|nr:MAG: transcriptional regulator [Lentisphaerae bacterium GWF2_52_8]